VASGPSKVPPQPPASGAAPPPVSEGGEGEYKGVARLLLKVPAFSGEVELELQGDAVTLRFNGLEAKGALPQLRSLCEQVGLLEKDYFALKEALRGLGLKVPEPPVPEDLARILPALSPSEVVEYMRRLPQGDLGLAKLIELAEREGWFDREVAANPKVALRRLSHNVRAQYAARLLEEWGLVRLVARETLDGVEGRCAVAGDRLLRPLSDWESVAARFFASALSREVLSYVEKHPATVASVFVPRERVNPWHLLRLRGGWVLDLRDLKLVPPSLCDWWFTVEVDVGLGERDLRELVDRVRRGDYDVKENMVYRLWRSHFSDEDWSYICDGMGTLLAPRRFKLVVLLKGDADVGKSSFLSAALKPIEELIASVPLSRLSDQFALQPLEGKWANVYTEEVAPTVRNLQIVNNLVGESDWIYVDRKRRDPIRIRSLKVMVFACNALPQVTSWSGGVMEAFLARLSVVLMEAPEDFKPERGIAERVPKAEGLAYLLHCRRQLEENGWEVRRRDRETLLQMLWEAQSPVYRFLAERCTRDPQGRVERGKLYDEYVRWCADNGITKLLSRAEFYTTIRSMGFAEAKGSGGKRFFVGLRLISEEAERQYQEEVARWLEAA